MDPLRTLLALAVMLPLLVASAVATVSDENDTCLTCTDSKKVWCADSRWPVSDRHGTCGTAQKCPDASRSKAKPSQCPSQWAERFHDCMICLRLNPHFKWCMSPSIDNHTNSDGICLPLNMSHPDFPLCNSAQSPFTVLNVSKCPVQNCTTCLFRTMWCSPKNGTFSDTDGFCASRYFVSNKDTTAPSALLNVTLVDNPCPLGTLGFAKCPANSLEGLDNCHDCLFLADQGSSWCPSQTDSYNDKQGRCVRSDAPCRTSRITRQGQCPSKKHFSCTSCVGHPSSVWCAAATSPYETAGVCMNSKFENCPAERARTTARGCEAMSKPSCDECTRAGNDWCAKSLISDTNGLCVEHSSKCPATTFRRMTVHSSCPAAVKNHTSCTPCTNNGFEWCPSSSQRPLETEGSCEIPGSRCSSPMLHRSSMCPLANSNCSSCVKAYGTWCKHSEATSEHEGECHKDSMACSLLRTAQSLDRCAAISDRGSGDNHSNDDKDSSSGLPTIAIVAIALCGGALVLGVGGYIFYRRRQRQQLDYVEL